MNESKLIYIGPPFENIDIMPVKYCDDYLQIELDLESELFYELRKKNNIKPFKINASSEAELKEIKQFFNNNKETFYFIIENGDIIGSVLFIKNYIQSLCINKKYQRKGYGTRLTKYAVNKILSNGYKEIVLKVMEGNIPALNLYKKLGFKIVD